MKKIIYEEPSLKVILLDSADVISTSGAFNGEDDTIRDKDKEVNTPIIKF